jgi:hypothetical protein
VLGLAICCLGSTIFGKIVPRGSLGLLPSARKYDTVLWWCSACIFGGSLSIKNFLLSALFVLWVNLASAYVSGALDELNRITWSKVDQIRVHETAVAFVIIVWFLLTALWSWLGIKKLTIIFLCVTVLGLLFAVFVKLGRQEIMQIITSIMVLGIGLAGFFFLDAFKATLWFFFILAAYPPALAVTRSGPWETRDVIQIYKLGISQIPFIGRYLSSTFNVQETPAPPIDLPRDNSDDRSGQTHSEH